jgi:uncharacterized DUF497 family protein
MRIELVWQDDREEHIGRHGVDIEEVLEVFHSRHVRTGARRRRARIIGATQYGRILTIIVERLGPVRFALITARDSDERERRFFRRRMGTGR